MSSMRLCIYTAISLTFASESIPHKTPVFLKNRQTSGCVQISLSDVRRLVLKMSDCKMLIVKGDKKGLRSEKLYLEAVWKEL